MSPRAQLVILYMKPTHYTIYTVDIKWHNVYSWLIGSCRDDPLTQRRKSYNIGLGKTQYKKQTHKLVTSHSLSSYCTLSLSLSLSLYLSIYLSVYITFFLSTF